MEQLRLRKKMPVGEMSVDIAGTPINEEQYFTQAKTAFELLGEKCRQLLILFYHRQQSFRDIAATLQFSDEKVAKNQKYRCLQKAKDNYLTLANNSNNE
jgi:DNA-directed RNA polymerase specialized sigma24 family protein